MGTITISIAGSFTKPTSRIFSAMETGHADAVAQAIEWLAKDVLPPAIQNDHACHEDGARPSFGFGRPKP